MLTLFGLGIHINSGLVHGVWFGNAEMLLFSGLLLAEDLLFTLQIYCTVCFPIGPNLLSVHSIYPIGQLLPVFLLAPFSLWVYWPPPIPLSCVIWPAAGGHVAIQSMPVSLIFVYPWSIALPFLGINNGIRQPQKCWHEAKTCVRDLGNMYMTRSTPSPSLKLGVFLPQRELSLHNTPGRQPDRLVRGWGAIHCCQADNFRPNNSNMGNKKIKRSEKLGRWDVFKW